MARQRGVRVLRGSGERAGPHTVDGRRRTRLLRARDPRHRLATDRAPGVPTGIPRVMDSTDALALADVPERLLVVGGGIIGLELASVYDALGSRVTIVELAEQLCPGCDATWSVPLRPAAHRALRGHPPRARLWGSSRGAAGLEASFSRQARPGRPSSTASWSPSGASRTATAWSSAAAGVERDERGFVLVDASCARASHTSTRSATSSALPMLAHKAHARGQGRRRGRSPAWTSPSTSAGSPRSPTPTPKSPGSA